MGMISGTSVDGIDIALVRIAGAGAVELVAAQTISYAPELRAEILAVCAGAERSLFALSNLDDQIATAFGNSALGLIQQTGQTPDFIASHGQTVWHRPPQDNQLGYSWQMGRGEVIAQITGIPTIADFRRADVAVGGEGAPLVPMVDWLLLTDPSHDRVVQNIGGISNFTYLPAGAGAEQVWGCDNAPGNVLIDLAMTRYYGRSYDKNGEIGRSGQINSDVVEIWLQDHYLQKNPPKSTGREYFNGDYLDRLAIADPRDLIASLTEFTARAIANSYQQFLPRSPHQVIVGGGGSRNSFLLERLKFWVSPAQVLTSDQVGINADFKEAIAFAVLGYLKIHDRPANLPAVTGAKRAVPLGQLFIP
jgi:anhydro-N-acetylmuramic acid kinase